LARKKTLSETINALELEATEAAAGTSLKVQQTTIRNFGKSQPPQWNEGTTEGLRVSVAGAPAAYEETAPTNGTEKKTAAGYKTTRRWNDRDPARIDDRWPRINRKPAKRNERRSENKRQPAEEEERRRLHSRSLTSLSL
jgi:hypothetical protein